ncbi:MAG TPA: restriction endonuclease [Verrucomicrobiae bacterium]
MATWLIRAGAHGEYEQKVFSDKKVYATWPGLSVDLAKLSDRSSLIAEMTRIYPDSKPKAIINWASQLWPFAHEIKRGDLFVLPLKTQPAIQIGEITGDYQYDPKAADPFNHSRAIKWIGEAIPRDNFSQDLLFSFGAFLTICRIQRNNAEARIQAMRQNGWKPETLAKIVAEHNQPSMAETEDSDLEELANDQIAQLISARFKGHDLTRLVDAVLRAQGYTTYLSPEGADGGADILAGSGPLGFGSPRLCVEVKSEDNPIGREPVDKLLGAISKFQAQEGLFVSLSGFKQNVFKEMAASFFKIRLWTRSELLTAIFANYDKLDESIKAELPLKRIWSVATPKTD